MDWWSQANLLEYEAIRQLEEEQEWLSKVGSHLAT